MATTPTLVPNGAEPRQLLLNRLSLNQITANRSDTPSVVAACSQHDIGHVGLWRDKIDALGTRTVAALVREAGLSVSSLCRGGFFPAAGEADRRARIDDNRRAIEQTAELGASVLVLVCGPSPGRDLDGARRMVADGIAAILPDAERAGIKLGIEPLHPVFTGDRSVVVTLAQAIAMAEAYPADCVGVVIDTYHVWWDPHIYEDIRLASGRIVGFHVSDWLVPSPDPLMGRGLMGDGVIEIRRLRMAADAAGYDGPIEVEIMNEDVWGTPLDQILPRIRERFAECV